MPSLFALYLYLFPPAGLGSLLVALGRLTVAMALHLPTPTLQRSANELRMGVAFFVASAAALSQGAPAGPGISLEDARGLLRWLLQQIDRHPAQQWEGEARERWAEVQRRARKLEDELVDAMRAARSPDDPARRPTDPAPPPEGPSDPEAGRG